MLFYLLQLGIIEDVILLGAPVTASSKQWAQICRVVGGRVINGYCETDWLLNVVIIVLILINGVRSSDSNLLHRLRESKFDIALHETYDLCSVGIFEVLGISKTIALSALGMTAYLNEVAGLPPLPSFIPGSFTTFIDEMTFTERFLNIKIETEMNYRYWLADNNLWQRFNEHYPGFPNLKDLLKKTGFTETPRPTTNMVQYIGGATLHEPGKIDEVDRCQII
uniref:glucuronosyltransferase n=1 Tax=Heterorhabditis bacteriophora TaxID=37862 RepID=A0A1I7X1E8_HETBA